MMYYMLVPKKINMMTQTMVPVTGKIQCQKTDHPHCPCGFDFHQRKMLQQIRVSNDNDAKPKGVFNHIGKAGAETAHGIHNIVLLFLGQMPVEHFKKHQDYKKRYGI